IHGRKEGRPPETDLGAEVLLQQTLLDAIRSGLIRSAHDCAEGGMAVALAECCISGDRPVGAKIELPDHQRREDEELFHEAPGRVIVSVDASSEAALAALCAQRGVPALRLGTTGGADLTIELRGREFQWDVEGLFVAWDSSLGDLMDAVAEPLAAH
ncbi:MAG: AIR synthase-related protein, partial [Chthoniobacterales bacterium]